MPKTEPITLPPKVIESSTSQVAEQSSILLDVTKQFYCIRCAKAHSNESRCEITIGDPLKMSLFKYLPICPTCLGQLQERFRPKPQQS